jgi:hypothetical protein
MANSAAMSRTEMGVVVAAASGRLILLLQGRRYCPSAIDDRLRALRSRRPAGPRLCAGVLPRDPDRKLPALAPVFGVAYVHSKRVGNLLYLTTGAPQRPDGSFGALRGVDPPPAERQQKAERSNAGQTS